MEMTRKEKQAILRDLLISLMKKENICAYDAYRILSPKTGLTPQEIQELTDYDCYGN